MRPTSSAMARVNVGTVVEAERDGGDGDFERCTIKALDMASATVSVLFEGGFVREGVPLSSLKWLDNGPPVLTMPAVTPEGETKPATAEADDEEAIYRAEVGPLLPPVPSAVELAADPEVKYAFVKLFKEQGNKLFKDGRLEWAIRTYTDAVDALASNCFASRFEASKVLPRCPQEPSWTPFKSLREPLGAPSCP